MLVRLKAHFFADGRLFRRGEPPHIPVEIPDHLLDQLPPGSVVVDDQQRAKQEIQDASEAAKQKPQALGELSANNRPSFTEFVNAEGNQRPKPPTRAKRKE